MRIAIDIDSTLHHYWDLFALLARRRFGVALPYDEQVTWDIVQLRREQVAALVAEGLTNRDIAERLHITERSAESHLERIRLRLGFRSRAQVAAWYVASAPQVR